MTLIQYRVDECFWLLSMILPIGADQRKNVEIAFGEDLSKALPKLFEGISKVCQQYPEDFDGYLTFVQQSIDYMRGYSDKRPEIDTEDYDKMILVMRKALGENTSSKAS